VSSSDARDALGGGSSGFISLEPAVDLVAEPAAQGPDRLGFGVAGGQAFGNVSLPETRPSVGVLPRFCQGAQPLDRPIRRHTHLSSLLYLGQRGSQVLEALQVGLIARARLARLARRCPLGCEYP